jgi:formimidoylglutamate deiminase
VAERLVAATLVGGAQASGRATGALRIGCRADWLVLDAQHPSIDGRSRESWLAGVVFCEHGASPIRDVYTGGKCIVQAGKHFDEAQAYAAYREAMVQWLR